MPKATGQKTKLLHLLDFLQLFSDPAHPVTVQQMIGYLESQGISAERKSIYSDLSCLKEYGCPIETVKHKTTGYYLKTRTFLLGELNLLSDCVASSQFIPEEKTRLLIEKLGSLTSRYQSGGLKRQIYVQGRKAEADDDLFAKVDCIHLAIASGARLCFQYAEYTVEKKKILRQAGQEYVVSPYGVTFDQERYYLIAYHEKYQAFSNFRVDKMQQVHLSSLPIQEVEFDQEAYLTESFSMFSGQPVTITLELENDLIGVIIDRFGSDVTVKKQSAKTFTVSVPIIPSPAFWGWLFQLGEKARLKKPKSMVAEYKQRLKATRRLYKE